MTEIRMEEPKRELLLCECESAEHQILFTYYPEEEEVYVQFHLRHLPWHLRLVQALKYVFGYKCKYGCFDEVILHKSKLIKLADSLKQDLQ